jgi:hypothetical protein
MMGFFLFATACRQAVGPTQPPIPWVPAAFSPRVKRQGHKTDRSPLSNAEAENAWSYTTTPQYVFTAWYLVKHRDNFAFTLTSAMVSICYAEICQW